MRTLKTVFNIIMTTSLILLTSNINIFANSIAQNEQQTLFSNSTFEITVNGTKYTVIAPSDPIFAPITVRIIDNGEVLFQGFVQTSFLVNEGIIENRVVGDGIDHKVIENTIEHGILEVSQNGLVLLIKEI